MRYLSVCSGIEAASVAWEPLGWEPVGFSEIEPFARSVLTARFPDVPLHGDFTKLIDDAPACDVLVGGTPCQAFSVAGHRRSLDDARGNLSLAFIELANAIDRRNHAEGRPPCITVWENVPGVFSTRDNAFGCFLGGLSGEDVPLEPPGGRWTNAGGVLGPTRSVCWRVLDAQYFGLAQRRRRVFVVASARDGFDPAEVLLEWESMRRDHPPRRAPREDAAAAAPAGAAGGGRQREAVTVGGQRSHALTSHGFDASEDGTGRGTPIAAYVGNAEGGALDAPFLTTSNLGKSVNNQTPLLAVSIDVTHSLRSSDGGVGEDGTGRGTPIVASFPWPPEVADPLTANEQTYTQEGFAFRTRNVVPHQQPLVFDTTQVTHPENRCNPRPGDPSHPLASGAKAPAVAAGLVVRRLTPVECEKLQGFPPGFTALPGKGGKEPADGPRYKALGNSMAVPVMRWIGHRIVDHVADLERSKP